jgi:hypothetical protein
MDFSSSVASHLLYLIHSITKQNFSSNASEVDKVSSIYGLQVSRFLLSYLVQEFQSVDVSQKDNLKGRLLGQVLNRLPKEPNFVSLSSEMLDEVVATTAVIPGTKRELLTQLCRVLNQPLAVQLTAGLGLSYSYNSFNQKEGINFLKNKLGEVTANVVKTLPENVLHLLLHFVSTTEQFTESERTLLNVESLRQSLLSLNPVNASAKEITTNKRKRETEMGRLVADLSTDLCLAGIMEEMGPVVTSSKQAFGALLDQFPSLTPTNVAKAVGLMAMRQQINEGDGTEHFASFLTSICDVSLEANAGNAAWNTEVFVSCISERYNLNWKDVLKNLDYPDFRISNQRGLAVILTLYKKATNEAMPVDPLFGSWKNRTGQLSFLQLLPSSPPDLVDWSGKSSGAKFVRLDGLPKVVSHICWGSLDLIETLLNLADTEHYSQVKQVFEHPIRLCMDLLLVGLMQAKPQRSELQNELIQHILQQYLLGRSSYSIIPHLLVNQSHSLAQGLALVASNEDTSMLNKILDLAMEYKWLESLLDACNKPSFIVALATLAAERRLFNLSDWLTQLFSGPKSSTFKVNL